SSNNDIPSHQSDSMPSNLYSRYWMFLFDNLKRSIEQIYQTCETDHDPLQCQEVIEFLCQYCKDFEILMKKCQLTPTLNSNMDPTKR
ncbi:unnamed protein product, partial [Rotaria magnacalcarata]